LRCERERKETVKRAQRALEEKLKRDERIQKHLKEVAKVEEEIQQITQSMKDACLESEQKAILAQKRMDLAAAKERANRTQNSRQEDPLDIYNDNHPKSGNTPFKKSSQTSPGPATPTPGQHSKPREHIKTAVEHNESHSKTEWQRQKDQENAHNPAIDKIMEMIGLEDVKAQVLRIKAKVETSIRQGTDLRKERLGLVLLGNPGTGIFFIQSFKYHRSNHAKAKQLWPGTMRKF
jgi:DNA repair exonuclease SbcCD ATPase subunit